MTRARAAVVLALALVLAGAGAAAAATQGRIAGEVLDSEGAPVADAVVVVRAQEMELEQRDTTNRKGKFTIQLTDASRTYVIRIEKDGYVPIEEPIDPLPGGTIRPSFVLRTAQQAAQAMAEMEEKNKPARAYNEGARLYEQGDLDGAIVKMKESLEGNPELVEPWLALARIHLERQEWEQALAASRRVKEMAPDDALGLRMLYDALWELEKIDEAAEVLELLVAADPGKAVASRIYNVGVRELKAENQDAALAQFRRAVEVDPELWPAQITVAQYELNAGAYAEALARTDLVLAAEPDNARAQMVKLQAHRALGQVDEAEAVFAKLQAGDPKQLAETYFREGEVLFNRNQPDLALAAFQRVVEVDPTHASARYMLGLCYLNAGELDKARAELRRFLEIAPEHPEAGSARQMLEAL